MTTQRSTGFRRLAVTTTALALALVALGGTVRATHSGLACPDYPLCFGLWVPPDDLNMWLEHSHRLLAGVVGLCTLALAVWAVARHRRRPGVLWASVAALVLVIVQAALGAVVVLRLLEAGLVTAHLGMAMVVVACLLYVALRAGQPASTTAPDGVGRLGRISTAVAGLCFVQILVGGHVTGIGAGLAYTDFPLMGGAVIPQVGTEQEAFHVAHRLLAYALAVGVGVLVVASVRHRRLQQATGRWTAQQQWLVRLPQWAALLVVVQILLGVANLHNGTSFVTVIPHLAVASWIWTILVAHAFLARGHAPALPAAPTVPDPVPEGAPA